MSEHRAEHVEPGAELRVEVIRDRCAGYANCLDAAPGIFDLDDHDVAVVLVDPVPVDQAEVLDMAVRRCPAKAIVVTKTCL